MGIDIEALRTEAERDGRDCVVTRRWLRQVLSEIEAARAIPRQPAAAALDFKTLERR